MPSLPGPHRNPGQSDGEFLKDHEPVRLCVMTDQEEFPDEFEGVLEAKILGYREKAKDVDGHQVRFLVPIWTLVPKDERLPLNRQD